MECSEHEHELEFITSTQCDKLPDEEPHLQISLTEKEKNSLQTLNDRLAHYVDTVRKLGDSSINIKEGESFEESFFSQNIDTVRSLYEKELAKIKESLDKESLEKSVLVLKSKQLEDENLQLSKKLKDVEKELQKVDSLVFCLEDDICDKDSAITRAQKELAHLWEKQEIQDKSLVNAKAMVSKLQASEKEWLAKNEKIMIELQSVQDELRFKKVVHQEEIGLAYESVKELKERITGDDSFTCDELNKLRTELKEEMDYAKNNVIASFKSRLSESNADLIEVKNELDNIQTEKIYLEQSINTMKIEMECQKSANNILELRLKNSEKDHKTLIDSLQLTIEITQKKLADSNEKLHAIMFDYEGVVGAHLSLDTELNAYKRLLDGEEKRLGLNTRKRFFTDTSQLYQFTACSGKKLIFCDADVSCAQFVKITNSSKKEATLSGFKIHLSFGETVMEFKIPKVSLPAADELTFYSSTYKGSLSPNNVVIQELKTFAPSTDSDNHIKLINSREQVISEAIISHYAPASFECSPRIKKRNTLDSTSRFLRSSTAISPIPKLRHTGSSAAALSKSTQKKETDDQRKSNCVIC